MPTSTATYILYNLRPSKQIERKLVFDTVASAGGVLQVKTDLPFIGMGGVRFIDFQLAHKIVGIDKFISIEHDDDIIPRCKFNRPFNSVTVVNQTVNDFLLAGGAKERAVVWLDFEGGLSENLLDDIQLLSGSVEPGSFVFITCKGVYDRSLRGRGPKQVRRYYQDQLGSFALVFNESRYGRGEFTRTAALLVRNMLVDGFQGRSEGGFFPYLKLTYTDTTPMVTAGGYFGLEKEMLDIRAVLGSRFPFLRTHDADYVYDIGPFNITEAERRLFDRAALSSEATSDEAVSLRNLGFREEDIATYRELMRYVPRYFEAFL